MSENVYLTSDLVRDALAQAQDGYRVPVSITIALCEALIGYQRITANLTRERDLARADLDQLRREIVAYRV